MDYYPLLRLAQIVGFIALDGGLLGVFVSELRAYRSAEVHRFAEAAWYTATFYDVPVLPGAVVVGLSGSRHRPSRCLAACGAGIPYKYAETAGGGADPHERADRAASCACACNHPRAEPLDRNRLSYVTFYPQSVTDRGIGMKDRCVGRCSTSGNIPPVVATTIGKAIGGARESHTPAMRRLRRSGRSSSTKARFQVKGEQIS